MEMDTPNTPSQATPQTAAGPDVRADLTKPNGPVAAVMLATGIGTVVLGLMTLLSEASEGIHEFLEWSERVGPLSGKTILGAGAFLVSWGGLHLALRGKEVAWRPVITATIVMIAIALVLTFPPFFQLFKSD